MISGGLNGAVVFFLVLAILFFVLAIISAVMLGPIAGPLAALWLNFHGMAFLFTALGLMCGKDATEKFITCVSLGLLDLWWLLELFSGYFCLKGMVRKSIDTTVGVLGKIDDIGDLTECLSKYNSSCIN